MELDDTGRRVWDISQPLRIGMPVWPGDTPFSEQRTWVISEQCPVNVSRLTLSTHAGTHADAPCHYDAEGRAIGHVSISPYIGIAQVLSVRPRDNMVLLDEVLDRLARDVKRVLLRTFDAFPANEWPSYFSCVSPALIDFLGDRGAVLIGVDTPSLDSESAKNLSAHAAVARNRMAILEGLVLDQVPDGIYELIALPLRLETADASPVRAILRQLNSQY